MNRKRIKKIALYLAILILFLLAFMKANGLRFRPDALHYACERGRHYGPSDGILLRYTPDHATGRMLVVSRCGGEGFSYTMMRRSYGLFWGPAYVNGSSGGFIRCDASVKAIYSYDCDLVYGTVDDPEAFRVVVSFKPSEGSGILIDPSFDYTVEAVPDEDGFFLVENVTERLGGRYDVGAAFLPSVSASCEPPGTPASGQNVKMLPPTPYAEAFSADGTLLGTSRDR